MSIDINKFPTTYLTLVGFTFKTSNQHPSDIISEMLISNIAINPHLLDRVRTTAQHVKHLILD